MERIRIYAVYIRTLLFRSSSSSSTGRRAKLVTGEEKASEEDRENKRERTREKGRAIGGEGGEGEVEEKVA